MSNELPDELRRALCGLLPALALPTVAAAQDATRIRPDGYRVSFENARVRVLEYTSRPGMGICGRGMHSHPAHLTVTLTRARARVTLPDGTIETRPELPAGTVFWSEAETHEVENVGGSNVHALLIELKA